MAPDQTDMSSLWLSPHLSPEPSLQSPYLGMGDPPVQGQRLSMEIVPYSDFDQPV